MIEPLENMRDLQSVNAKQRVGGVDAERSAPHISGVTPAMQRLAERRGIVPVDDRDVSSTSGDDSDASDAFDSSALVGAAGDRTSGSIWPVVERSILDEILAHRTTLVFVNSRGVAEKLTARLNDLYAQTRHGTNPDTVRDLALRKAAKGSPRITMLWSAPPPCLSAHMRAMMSSPWLIMGRFPKTVAK